MANFRYSIDGKVLKSCKLIPDGDKNDHEYVSGFLNHMLNKMKAQGYTHSQVTTRFDTDNEHNQYRTGSKLINLNESTEATMFKNLIPQGQRQEKHNVAREYFECVNANVLYYTVQYF